MRSGLICVAHGAPCPRRSPWVCKCWGRRLQAPLRRRVLPTLESDNFVTFRQKRYRSISIGVGGVSCPASRHKMLEVSYARFVAQASCCGTIDTLRVALLHPCGITFKLILCAWLPLSRMHGRSTSCSMLVTKAFWRTLERTQAAVSHFLSTQRNTVPKCSRRTEHITSAMIQRSGSSTSLGHYGCCTSTMPGV